MRFSPQTQEARPPQAGGLLGRNGRRRARQRRLSQRPPLLSHLAARLIALTALSLPLVIPAVYVFTVARHDAFLIGITNPDYFAQVDWALRLKPGEWDGWPAAMAWLIRLGLGLGIDVVRLAQAVSIIGGVLGLLGTYLLVRVAKMPSSVAVASQAFVALNPRYLADGGLESGSWPSAGLFILPIVTGAGVWILCTALERVRMVVGWSQAQAGMVVAALTVAAGLVSQGPAAAQYAAIQPRLPDRVTMVSDLLRGAGLQYPNEALSTEPDLQDLGDMTRLRYPQASSAAPGHETLVGLLDDARTKGFRFLIYGPDGPHSYPNLADLAKAELRPAGLIPIYSDPVEHRLAIYRLAPEIPPPPPVSVQFEGGIALGGVRVTAARRAGTPAGWMAGVYLRWAPQAALSRSYKVFVRLEDAQGKLVAQVDGVPAIGTYPTTAWKAGETLVDYHAVPIPDPVPAKLSMVIGLYDEATGERLARVDASRQAVDDKAVVGELVLESGAPRFRPAS